ncbi:MAG: type IV pilus twitching motility protein PilT [Elusimicrobia bacterium]|nr:type IV pilus twitching motility protein PilT [Elusimicrobiota bacterium]
MAELDAFFQKMMAMGASDLHLTSGMLPLVRESGEMKPLDGEAEKLTPESLMKRFEEIAPKLNWDEYKKDGDTDFAYDLPGAARFRANFFMDQTGPGAVFRVIPSKTLTVKDLNLPPSIIDLCFLTKGLVVVTGPTGSGKSTTLAAMINHINENRQDHIITIEDPIEFVHPNKKCLINQREVRKHTQSFKRALRAALREDPDIVLIGEMRDLETVEIALETAETGHLVFGTLHTTTAASTVDRVIDQFPTHQQAQIRTILSTTLKGVVAQTLCKKIPKGRAAALEILISNAAIANNIREGKTFQIPSAMQVGASIGMRMLNDSLMELVQKKIVEPLEAYMKCVDKVDMKAKLDRIGAKLPNESHNGHAAPTATQGAPR